ncbi:MAG: cobyric acid synthase [Bacteroidales bacterium]
MFVGTGSDVGKSIINTAFCRIFRQDGYEPAPFKAQNMSLNSYATAEGLEIGRAQAVQAEACQIPCTADMNPVLLKPNDDMKAQVVLNGKPAGVQSASEYFSSSGRNELFGHILQSYRNLSAKYYPIVIEGAGSISELNLRDRDVTNMRVALETQASTFLIADIDRGGVFGSVYGTLQLLPPEERKLIKGVIINKFRGDIKLFENGKKQLEELTGIPVVSVIPHFKDIHIEQEDSVVIETKTAKTVNGKLNVAVVLLRHMSNFTDFSVLERTPGVHLFYAAEPDDIEDADVVIIPGSKNSISDLQYLRKRGMAKAILEHHSSGKAVYGICGGYQIMGKEIVDPEGVESDIPSIPGLAILPVRTVLTREKTTEQCTFLFKNEDKSCRGYEIHMGETYREGGEALCKIKGQYEDGCFLNEKTWGTYIHGILDNIAVINRILKENGFSTSKDFDYEAFKQAQYDRLADHVRQHTDMRYIYQTLMKQG